MRNVSSSFFVFLFRAAAGWYFFYAGFTKVTDPSWSAAGYIENAKSFSAFFAWLASPANIGWVNFLNEWGLILVGAALLLGVLTRFAAVAGAAMLLLYYFPVLSFPYAGAHGFIVDDHIIAAAALLMLAAVGARHVWGIDSWIAKQKWGKYPFIRALQ